MRVTASEKRQFALGMKLYDAMMVLPAASQSKELTHLPGDGEWIWDYSTLHRPVWPFGSMSDEKPCGTAGCMLGMARALGITEYSNDLHLAEALGLDWHEVNDLAYGHAFQVGLNLGGMQKIGPHRVAKVLRNLLKARYPELMAQWEETVHA